MPDTLPVSALTTSPQGRQTIVNHEGIRYTAYQDAAGYWTIGVGHLIVPGDGIDRTKSLTYEQVMAYFERDLQIAENAIRDLVTVPITQGMFDALADFTFNLGVPSLRQSTLLAKLNSGDYQGAAEEFKRWIFAGGMQVAGLVTRRENNYQTFLT